ncbi:MAG: hypothetical protein HY265_05580 [Deltaproteobacteria bacterium]|nr:hypothetical protein [Deltaproteobacteria bacterium]
MNIKTMGLFFFILGVIAAPGGWLWLRKVEAGKRAGVIDEGFGGTLRALAGLLAYGLLLAGVSAVGVGIYLMFFFQT